MLPRWLATGQDLAIDLGTANTLISVVGQGLVLNEPSVVALQSSTKGRTFDGCAVGHLAKQMLGRTPDSISVVHPLKQGVITDFHMCEAMLRYFFQKTRRNRWSARPRALVAVPGCITPVEKQALFNSTLRSGAGQVLLIPEAKAGALGVGLPITEPVASMICDIGGGTTEVAVLSFGDIVSSASIRLGGDSMDQAVVDYLRRQHGLRIGLPTAERLRIELGSALPLDEELTDEVRGIDASSGLPRRMLISSEDIRAALADSLEKIVDAVRDTLDGCNPQLASDLVDYGMVLVGGGSLLRRLDDYLNQRTDIPCRVSPDALVAVAKGTLICLEQVDRWRSSLESNEDDVL